MNLKRAIWISVLAYIALFISSMIIAVTVGIDLSNAASVPDKVWYFGICATIIIIGLFTLWYFKGKKTKPSAKEGFHLGLVFIGVGFLIDIILILPWILFSNLPADPIAYYSNPLFWATLVIVVLTSTLVGHWKKKHKKKK